uniref:Uncharacterized protein n=1 Tax=Trichogramma kaykai TaxID=54128 RepID=A0ABD2XF09_9HYME
MRKIKDDRDYTSSYYVRRSRRIVEACSGSERRSGGSSELFSLGKPRESIVCVTSEYVHTIARRILALPLYNPFLHRKRVFKIYTDIQVRPSSSECLSAMNHEQQRQLLLQCLVRAVSSPTRRVVRRSARILLRG